jgi:hypothetical protein
MCIVTGTSDASATVAAPNADQVDQSNQADQSDQFLPSVCDQDSYLCS